MVEYIIHSNHELMVQEMMKIKGRLEFICGYCEIEEIISHPLLTKCVTKEDIPKKILRNYRKIHLVFHKEEYQIEN